MPQSFPREHRLLTAADFSRVFKDPIKSSDAFFTVLARACEAAGIDFDSQEAHSAMYDCEKTAELFCFIVNRWRHLGGLPD